MTTPVITATRTQTATIEEIVRYKFLHDLRSRSVLDENFGIDVKPLSDWWNALDGRDRERIAEVVRWSNLAPIDEILLQADLADLKQKALAIEVLKTGKTISEVKELLELGSDYEPKVDLFPTDTFNDTFYTRNIIKDTVGAKAGSSHGAGKIDPQRCIISGSAVFNGVTQGFSNIAPDCTTGLFGSAYQVNGTNISIAGTVNFETGEVDWNFEPAPNGPVELFMDCHLLDYPNLKNRTPQQMVP